MKRLAVSLLFAATCMVGCGAPPVVAPQMMAANQTQSQSLIGWWGESGKQRAVWTFAKEEGRAIQYVADENGSRMEAPLRDDEMHLLGSLLTLGPSGAKIIGSRDLPDGVYRKAVRHMKLFRRQNATRDTSQTVNFVRQIGPDGKPLAYAVRGYFGYQAFYSLQGRFLVAFAVDRPQGPSGSAPAPEDMEPDE